MVNFGVLVCAQKEKCGVADQRQLQICICTAYLGDLATDDRPGE